MAIEGMTMQNYLKVKITDTVLKRLIESGFSGLAPVYTLFLLSNMMQETQSMSNVNCLSDGLEAKQ